MSSPATLVATVTGEPSPRRLEELAEQADWLEVRADLAGDLSPDVLRDAFPGRLLYTLRSREEGGAAGDPPERRRERLAAAAEGYDLVDLEAERDLGRKLLERVPAEKRLLSWHGPTPHRAALRARWERMASTPARWRKLVTLPRRPGEALVPLGLLKSLGRDDVVAFAAGAMGVWTRLLAPRLGAPLVYGAAGEEPGAPGQPSIERLRADFGLPELPPVEACYGIVGNPALRSLSPRLHNGAYRDLGVPALYVPFEVPSMGDFWLEVVEKGSLSFLGVPLVGLSVTTPFKEVALVIAGASSPLADRLESANTLVVREGVWEAETTDPEGVLGALRHAGREVRGVRAAVVGCGGAGRAAAAGLALEGARVTLVNRGEERGRKAAEALHLPFLPLADFDPGAFEIVVHATPAGRTEDDPLPFDPARLPAAGALLDMNYGGEPTALLAAALRAGRQAIDGREMLLFQAVRQFRLMTGLDLPLAASRRRLGLPAEEPAAAGEVRE